MSKENEMAKMAKKMTKRNGVIMAAKRNGSEAKVMDQASVIAQQISASA